MKQFMYGLLDGFIVVVIILSITVVLGMCGERAMARPETANLPPSTTPSPPEAPEAPAVRPRGLPPDTGAPGVWAKGELVFAACASEDADDLALCAGFISGVDDAFTVMAPDGARLHCANRKYTIGDFRRAYLEFMATHPVFMGRNAAAGVAATLHETFPCPGQGGRKTPKDIPRTL